MLFVDHMFVLCFCFYLNACSSTTNRLLIKLNDEGEAKGKTLYAGPLDCQKILARTMYCSLCGGHNLPTPFLIKMCS